MDDAYQHRYVKPGLSILVMDYSRPLWKDIMLPAGELREPSNGKKRADIVLVSKCPQDLSLEESQKIATLLTAIGNHFPLLIGNERNFATKINEEIKKESDGI